MSANLVGGAEPRYLGTSSPDRQGPATLAFPSGALAAIVGDRAPIRGVLSMIKRVGPKDVAVLFRGETGTGKELVVRAIHACSRRADRPLVTVNCAAVPEALWEVGENEHSSSAALSRHRCGAVA